MFRTIGVPELVIILLILLLIFGASRLPQLGRAIGRTIREFREGLSGKGEEKEKSEEEQEERER
ncbi:MAG: twin-arginine translocase TatA/TatE family subunit [Chloroflexia bacterium]